MILEPTENEKKALKQGIKSEFWNVLSKFLDNDIEGFTARINEDDGIRRDEEERRILIETRRAYKQLRDYPEMLSQDQEVQEERGRNFDPYDKVKNETNETDD